MAELVLRDAGWNASSLGHMLPFATIRTAIEAHRPRLAWLSISAIRDKDRFVQEMQDVFTTSQAAGTALPLVPAVPDASGYGSLFVSMVVVV